MADRVGEQLGNYRHTITAEPDGNLWFTEGKGNKIGRITGGR